MEARILSTSLVNGIALAHECRAPWTSPATMEEGLTRDSPARAAEWLGTLAAFHQESVVIPTRTRG
ncbi:MAG: hypothetical protein M3O36_02345, partial [Myxococcota bacterium]|nr:hypothetical protein [Myxococcota bacterium]